MHIAILDEELPYPMTSGKRIRTFNLLRRLAGRHRLTFVCHRNADVDEARAAEKHFREIGIETIVVDRAIPSKSGLQFFARLAGNLLSPLPYSVATHASRELTRAVLELASRKSVDLWHCEWTPYAETMKSLAGVCWLVMAHNLESLIWQRMTENENHPARRWYIRKQWQKFERFESWAYSTADRVIAVTENDAHLMRTRFGATQVDVVDNGVDTSYFIPSDSPRDPKCLLFLGSLDWRPNLDAVTVLLNSIMPQVRTKEPDARLLIVGRNPPSWLEERAREAGIELCANVPDVRPYIAQAGILVVPLRIGGGSRLKILEALSSGTPVVSTRIGAEGLNLQNGQHLEIVDQVEEMAQALVSGIRQPQQLRLQANSGREQVLQHYDWTSLAERLEQVWIETARTSRNLQAA
jgi:glycosyltransferase involved in cell wall biosynthesis